MSWDPLEPPKPQPWLSTREKWWLKTLAYCLFAGICWGGMFKLSSVLFGPTHHTEFAIGTVTFFATLLGAKYAVRRPPK